MYEILSQTSSFDHMRRYRFGVEFDLGCTGLIGVVFVVSIWEKREQRVFDGLSPAQHLAQAKRLLEGNDCDLDAALGHIEGVPESAQSDESREMLHQLSIKKAEIVQAVQAEKQASDAKAAAAPFSNCRTI